MTDWKYGDPPTVELTAEFRELVAARDRIDARIVEAKQALWKLNAARWETGSAMHAAAPKDADNRVPGRRFPDILQWCRNNPADQA